MDILQWNCRGLRARSEQLKVMIHDFNPGIICLQETKIGNILYNPGLNYSMYHSPPPPGDVAHGGSAVIIHKSLQHSVLNLKTSLQAVAVEVILDKQITICSLYLPPKCGFTENDIQSLINELPRPFLLLGDFNAHNPLWGGNVLDSEGKLIEELLDNNPISLYNDGSMTYHNIHNNTTSAIDLSICSSSILLDFIWSVNEYLCGSDHFPIHLKYIKNTPTECPPKWKTREADWQKYRENFTLDREFESFDNHIEAYDYFTEEALRSAEMAIPKTKGKPNRPAVPWWNKTCGVLRKVTRKCYRRYKNSGSTQSKIIYKRALAKQRKYFKKSKRESWLYYINGINSKTHLSVVWRKVRKLSGKFVPSPSPVLKINESLITEPCEVAENLGKHFSKISSSENYSPEFQRIRNTRISLDLSTNGREIYNVNFSIQEFEEALSSTESTAPGEDTILYEMIKNLPKDAKIFLLKIINRIWETGILPKSWKIAIVIPVKKPNKNPFESSSYRPIALTSCVCKLMEKMINTRLVWYLESEGKLSPYQFGFRKNRSTLDPLLRLSNQIQQGFSKQCQTIGIFFDLEKAYDTTCRSGIIQQFYKMGIRGNMIRFINSFLSERFLKVRVGNSVSAPFIQEEGVPQGSVLSVTCFAVAINSILEVVTPPVKSSLFVDDLAIYCTSYDALSACKHLQNSIDAISRWANTWGFKFSTVKTVAVRFTRCRRREVVPTLTLNGNILPYAEEVKFLGMIFDSKLTWGSHIDALKLKVKKTLNILKVISSFSWGADRKSLLMIYNALCRSKIEYGCQIYSSACKTRMKALDAVHNMGLRICSGAFRTSPVESIYVDTGELPLDLRREELGLRLLFKIKTDHNNPAFDIFKNVNGEDYKGPRSSKPLQVRLNEQVEDTSIKTQKVFQVAHPPIPPWIIPEISKCSIEITKKNTPIEQVKSIFLEHDRIHKDHVKIFTDGSKSYSGIGCAVIHDGTSYLTKLPDSASIFTAEITGINNALKLVDESKGESFVIYCDSKSVLDSIGIFNSFHPLIQKAQEWLFRISCRHKKVYFCWVPSHVGIQGNELVDREAKDATQLDHFSCSKVPHYDMKRKIKNYVLDKWQKLWSSPVLPNNRKYKTIRDSIAPWTSVFHSNRKVEVVLTRLRIGHTRLTHGFILDGNGAPVCDHCDLPLSVDHILVHCTKFLDAKRKYGLHSKSLSEILGEDVNISQLFGFLEEISILN